METKCTLKPEAQLMQEPSADACCDPYCGPETCGSGELVNFEAVRIAQTDDDHGEDATLAQACSCTAAGSLSTRQRITTGAPFFIFQMKEEISDEH